MEIQYIGMACALGLSAIGSGFGAGAACLSSVGAWKKCYASGKPAPFIMVAFSGAPLTQTIYGFLLMNFIRSAVEGGDDDQGAFKARGHVVEALGDGQGGHADGEQPDIAHDVAKGADGVEEHRKGVGQTGLETLGEALVRGHAAEEHHQHEAHAHTGAHGSQRDVLADDQVQGQKINGADGNQPAQVGDPAEVSLRKLALDAHHAGQSHLPRAPEKPELHTGVLQGSAGPA